MSVAAQAIAARRKAKIDPRYVRLTRKSLAARERKFKAMLQKQKDMAARKGAKKNS